MSFCQTVTRHTRRWIVCAAAVALAAASAFAAPNITSPEPEFDFGEKDNNGEVTHSFIVKNDGDEPLIIQQVKSSCGCTVATLKEEDKTVAPGKEVPITATFNLHGRTGDQVKQISVMSNDADTPTYTLTLKGKAIAPILIEPAMLTFDNVAEGSDVSGSVVVKAGKEDVSFKLTKAESQNPNFQTTIEPVNEGKEYKVSVKSLPNLPAGFQSTVIQLATDTEIQKNLQFTVTARVVGPFDVNPKRLALLASTDAEPRKYELVLNVTPGAIKEFEVTKVDVPDAAMSSEISKRPNGGYEIKLHDVPAKKELDGKEVVLHTSIESKPEVRVPIKIIERPVAEAQPIATAPAPAPSSK